MTYYNKGWTIPIEVCFLSESPPSNTLCWWGPKFCHPWSTQTAGLGWWMISGSLQVSILHNIYLSKITLCQLNQTKSCGDLQSQMGSGLVYRLTSTNSWSFEIIFTLFCYEIDMIQLKSRHGMMHRSCHQVEQNPSTLHYVGHLGLRLLLWTSSSGFFWYTNYWTLVMQCIVYIHTGHRNWQCGTWVYVWLVSKHNVINLISL